MRLGLWTGGLRPPLNCEAIISKAKAIAREPIRTPVHLWRGVSDRAALQPLRCAACRAARVVALASLWPTVRDGKLYARGSADNKAEIASRLTAIRALRTVLGEFPVTLRWILEGEEEVGSPHFGAIASTYTDLLQADACFWEGEGFGPTGRPELLLGTKGLLYQAAP